MNVTVEQPELQMLIDEYDAKILICDKKILNTKSLIRAIRKGESSSKYITMEEALNELKVVNTERQCYVQFIYDIESVDMQING